MGLGVLLRIAFFQSWSQQELAGVAEHCITPLEK